MLRRPRLRTIDRDITACELHYGPGMSDRETTHLRRSLGFWALVVYGVGDILGAGIYALVGKIAGIAGNASWIAFGVALGTAAFTALSYAELGSRFPKSGGESQFCQQAFRSPGLSLLIGWLVFCSGIVSMAAVSHAFSGYLLGALPGAHQVFSYVVMVVFLLVLSGINFWGIRQSSMANIACTIVETSGLLLVMIVGTLFLLNDAGSTPPVTESVEAVEGPWWLITQGAALAFFAFIGFEDMVNVAEEVTSPERVLPAAILIALAIAGVVYVIVAYIATSVVPAAQLAASEAPLLEVVHRAAPRFPRWIFSLIALFAVANTGLLNCIMGSRLLYGMSEQGLLPAGLRRIHPRTQTPIWAIVAILIAATALALSGSLVYLAGTTSVLLLTVFATVNVSLVVVKMRETKPAKTFRVPLAVPLIGVVTSLCLIVFLPGRSLLTALGIVAAGLLLVLIRFFRREKAGTTA